MRYMRTKQYRLSMLPGFILVVVFLYGGASVAEPREPGNFANGSRVWVANCSRCHNMRGASELRDDQWISSTYHMRLRAGLTGQETRDVIAFLQASNNRPSATDSSRSPLSPSQGLSGKEIFEKNCMACHGKDGKGALPGVSDFNSSAGPLMKTDAVLLRNMINGFQSTGSPMAMPPKGGNPALSAADMSAVLQYIRETFGK